MREREVGELPSQKGTELVPAITRREIHHQEVVRTLAEMSENFLCVPLEPLDIQQLVSFRGAFSVDPPSHRRLAGPKMTDLALNPQVRWPHGKNEFASRVFEVKFFVENWPWVVLKSIVLLDKIISHVVNVVADVLVINPVGPRNGVTKQL